MLEADVEDCMVLAVYVVVVEEGKTEIDSLAVGCCVATLPHISDPTFDLHLTASIETPGVFIGVRKASVPAQAWLLP